MKIILAIAAGGAIGAVSRHILNNGAALLWGTAFPWGIFIANILGSFLMGCLISYFALMNDPSHTLKAFLTVGILGAFTTFSTFSLDAVSLIEKGAFLSAMIYILGSVTLAIIGLFAGMSIIRALLT